LRRRNRKKEKTKRKRQRTQILNISFFVKNGNKSQARFRGEPCAEFFFVVDAGDEDGEGGASSVGAEVRESI